MTVAALVLLALKLSIALQVFALGLKSTLSDVAYLPRHPMRLLRSLLSMNVVMLLFVAALVLVFDIPTPVKIMLVAVALSPVPPLLPKKQTKAGGSESYAVSLICMAALVAIISIPLLLEALERVYDVPLQMSPLAVAQVMAPTVLLPIGAGIALRAMAPKLADRVGPPLLAVATAILPVAAIGIIVAAWPAIMAQLGDGTLLVIVAFVAVGLAVGHVLGGPEPADRTVLALATASRHPGAAAAIASANFPEMRAALALLLLYLIVGAIASALYLRWRKAAAPSVVPHARAR